MEEGDDALPFLSFISSPDMVQTPIRRLGSAHFELQGCIWFFIAALGYVTYDIMFGLITLYCTSGACQAWINGDRLVPTSVLLTNIWAAIFLLDSFLYLASLLVHSPDDRGKFVFWSAEVGNVVASALFMASQAMYFHPGFLVQELDPFFRVVTIQAMLYAAAMLIWLYNSLQYFAIYWQWRKANAADALPLLRDIWFYAELLNVIPSIGYFYTSLWALLVLYRAYWESIGTSQIASFAAFAGFFVSHQRLRLVVNFVFDLMFCVCAFLYGAMWYYARKDDAMIKTDAAGYYELPEYK